MRNLSWVLPISAFIVAALFLSVHSAVLLIPKSNSYFVRERFTALPASDEQLLIWLKEQPGIVPNTVRAKRKDKAVEVGFIQVRNGLGKPAFPDLERKTKELGYRGTGTGFVDVPR